MYLGSIESTSIQLGMLAFAAKGQVLWDEYMANTVPQSKSVEATLGMAWKERDF